MTKKINFLILAHKNPEQLNRLINRLHHDGTFFYIHLDKKKDIASFSSSFKNLNVNFCEDQFDCAWGDLAIVKATLSLMEKALKTNPEGRMVLLSGQDYPIKTNAYTNQFFSQNSHIDFIDIAPIKTVFPTEWKSRLYHYKYNLSNKRGNYVLIPPINVKAFYTLRTLKYLAKIGIRKPSLFLKKEFRKNLITQRNTSLEPFAGSQWWSFTAKTSKIILDYCYKNPEYIAYYEYSFSPDELFFQTLLMHLKKSNPEITIQNSLTFVDWSRKNVPLPVTFTQNDVQLITNLPSNKIFARKFDMEIDAAIFDLLDAIH